MGDIRGVAGSEKHQEFLSLLIEESCFFIYVNLKGLRANRYARGNVFYVLLPYIIYVMQPRRFSQSPAFLSRTAKERDKKYSVKSL